MKRKRRPNGQRLTQKEYNEAHKERALMREANERRSVHDACQKAFISGDDVDVMI